LKRNNEVDRQKWLQVVMRLPPTGILHRCAIERNRVAGASAGLAAALIV
jgi:hypothetical protein